MFQPAGKFDLPGKNHGEEVSVAVLQICQQTQILQVDRCYGVGLVDKDQAFLPFPSGEKNAIKQVQEF